MRNIYYKSLNTIMGKNVLLLVIFILSAFLSHAQGFLDEENVWGYLGVDWVEQQVLKIEYKIEGDTLINGLSYKKLLKNGDVVNPTTTRW